MPNEVRRTPGVAPGTTPTGSFGRVVFRFGRKPRRQNEKRLLSRGTGRRTEGGTEVGVSPFHRGSAAGSVRSTRERVGCETSIVLEVKRKSGLAADQQEADALDAFWQAARGLRWKVTDR